MPLPIQPFSRLCLLFWNISKTTLATENYVKWFIFILVLRERSCENGRPISWTPWHSHLLNHLSLLTDLEDLSHLYPKLICCYKISDQANRRMCLKWRLFLSTVSPQRLLQAGSTRTISANLPPEIASRGKLTMKRMIPAQGEGTSLKFRYVLKERFFERNWRYLSMKRVLGNWQFHCVFGTKKVILQHATK